MRYSRLLIPTLKEAPAEAQVVSHVLLIRAGYIRKIAAGVYTLLPLGMRVVHKIQRILREELTRAGACEVLPPFVQPGELWMESGRWQKYGPELLRFKDRKGADFVLAPTAEEAFCELVRRDVRSYRQLPLNLFQIQDKFRDEMRPRAGLMRGREFIMKDGYSFHATVEDAHREYQAMYDAYTRIFTRCGLDFRAVEADTGAIGGNKSHEFQVLADSGEDALVSCDTCGYAANVEKAELRRSDEGPAAAKAPLAVISTPNVTSIADVAALLKESPKKLVKTLVYVADGKPVVACVRGDRDLNELKLKALLKADALELASDALVVEATGAKVGYAGPHGVVRKIPVYADLEVAAIPWGISGANQADAHVTGFNLGRDCPEAQVVDLRTAAAGDRCARCETGTYRAHRGIEVGHVFYLGTRYSEPMKVVFLDADGKEKPMEMGCYGIGVTRIAAAAIEQHHDPDGIKWPMALAPFQVAIVTAGKEPELAAAAEQIERDLEARGLEVLYDDRDERAGGKFKDADLIGIPLRITIGKRELVPVGVQVGPLEAGEHGDGEHGAGGPGTLDGGAHHVASARGVDGEEARAVRRRRRRRAPRGLGDVVELEIEEHVAPGERAHGVGARGREQLESDLQRGGLVAQPGHQRARLGQRRHIERDEDPVHAASARATSAAARAAISPSGTSSASFCPRGLYSTFCSASPRLPMVIRNGMPMRSASLNLPPARSSRSS